MPREFDLISWIRTQQTTSARIPLAAGDDLAILKPDAGDLLLIGIDQVLDGVHFQSEIHAPIDIGRKAMNRNLSDCAAMACLPAAAVVSFALPKGCSDDYARALYTGIKAAGAAFDCPIIGGDTGAWPGPLAITVAITGRSAGITPVRRSGAQPGDHLYVTGPLGGSILGRHLTFTPRVRAARDLAQHYPITAMIDLSDGLSRDLAHLCHESNVGADLDAKTIPIHPDVSKLTDGRPALDHALNDGEDHELCFTSPADIPASLATRIGTIATTPGIRLDGHPLTSAAFEHIF